MNDRLRDAFTAFTRAFTSTKTFLMDQLTTLWAIHTQALRTRSSYRAEIVALVIGVICLISLPPPLDLVVVAAVTEYVGYYQTQTGPDPRNGWI